MNTSYKFININRFKRFTNTGAIALCGLLMLTASGCKKNFEDYATDDTGIPDSEIKLPTLLPPLQSAIFKNYQTAQNLSADAYAGYMMSPTPFIASYNLNYTMVDGWNRNGFNDQYTFVMAPVNKMAKLGLRTSNPDMWAIALIVKVEAMHRVTDKFGPIPYSAVGKTLTNTPYDSQQAVYTQFFNELDTAVSNLQTYIAANPSQKPFTEFDRVYGGDYTKWLKFANSLRLRLAMHIVKADPATAKLQAEKAMNASNGGLLTTVADNAAIAVAPGSVNDLFQLTNDYTDNRLSATMATYLTGYNDPRLTSYATSATDAAFSGQYVGIRIGSAIPSKQDYTSYASINTASSFTMMAPQQIMTAAEVCFLKAEAGLRGWAGAGDVKTNYEQGITVSMQQWGINNATAYINDATSKQANYTDPKNAANNIQAVSTVTIKWDEAATPELKLERIMTQKWLAVFPEGQEAWTEFRRTGYPKLFPVVNNTSNGLIDTQIQIRRLPYPSNEYSANGTEVGKAVQSIGGKDNGGVRVWWDIAKGNF